PVAPDSRCRATMTADLVTDLAGPGTLSVSDPVTCRGVARRDGRPYLIDRLKSFGEVHTTGELEEHDRALHRDHERAGWVTQVENLHVPCVAGVADAHRVDENARVDRAPRHLVPDPAQAVTPKRHHVDRVLRR